LVYFGLVGISFVGNKYKAQCVKQALNLHKVNVIFLLYSIFINQNKK